jgi:5-oxoprolinase (ATP-hydrolysing)
MSFAVKYQIETLGPGGIEEGDVLLTNAPKVRCVLIFSFCSAPDNPCLLLRPDLPFSFSHESQAGGSHLPDITVITPVFDSETKEIIFFTASRGHHAGSCSSIPQGSIGAS